VQIIEFMCTSGFPALFTRILTLKQLDRLSYYGYLLLYDLAYMLDDVIVLAIGVITLSQRRLQEKEGRWLKLVSGLVMVGLGVYLLLEKYISHWAA
ncbi:MAG: NrdH-redoxin, partial [Betaproteobacteria bacterium]|nr:NrdH-redoxin [Betaproteobacteria bacterium]